MVRRVRFLTARRLIADDLDALAVGPLLARVEGFGNVRGEEASGREVLQGLQGLR